MITAKRSSMDVILTFHSSEYNENEFSDQRTNSLVS